MKDDLKLRFEGCLVGALVGDCLGSYFETGQEVDKAELQRHIDLTEANKGTNIKLTDDTQMTQELADSLIFMNGFDAKDLAQRFTNRYFFDGKDAGYGSSVEIFEQLKNRNFENPLLPAQEQFGGEGSQRNGAAMRVAPVALFGFPDLHRTGQLAEQNARVTHSHLLGRHGAVMQALAVRRCLLDGSNNYRDFLLQLEQDLLDYGVCKEYLEVLSSIKNLMKKERLSKEEVVNELGTDVLALKSVPTALFCFLRSFDAVSTEKAFRNTFEHAISLGGDTDTIASMSASLAGARYGIASIHKNTILSCPDWERAILQGDKLYDIATGQKQLTL